MMNIAIKGHILRGKEVIQILESLGGINTCNYSGNNFGAYYELHGNSIVCMSTKSDNVKYYTLEEFEKEFPFKTGEVVFTTVHSTTFKGVVKNINFNDTIYPYDCSFEDSGKCSLGGMNVLVKCKTNQLFKMQEERNITLTLDKAKEWYKKGGELKEIALQAYSEKELTKIELPKTWEEFCDNYMIDDSEAYFDNCCTVYSVDRTYRNSLHDRNICPSEKSAKAHLAMIQLEQLRDCWRQGWEPIWDCSEKWCIRLWGNELAIGITTNISRFLTFPTKEMAEEFLKCFRDLIEQAENLI